MKSLSRGREEEADKEIVRRVEDLATKKSISMAQIAMAWVFSEGDMMPICGLEPEKRIDQDVEAVGVTPERGGDETS